MSKPNTISILVYRNDLKSMVDNGLPKVNFLQRIKLFRTFKRVNVHAAPYGTKDSIFYAPYTPLPESRATPVQGVHISSEQVPHLVRQNHDFEVSFVGMSVTPQDAFSDNYNELLLYSLSSAKSRNSPSAYAPNPVPTVSMTMHSPTTRLNGESNPNMSSHSVGIPTGFSVETDMPYIHYDPVVDGHNVGNEPHAFVSIPATKRLYLQNCSSEEPQQKVYIRFTIMEIDKVSDVQARAISGLDQLGSYVSTTAVAVPYLELLTRAFAVASSLGKHGLKKYSKPDHVLSMNEEFLLAPEEEEGDSHRMLPCGNYLRYGYLFFLSKKVDAQLYAQTNSSTQCIQLMLRREAYTSKMKRKNEKEYFPLTGVSYLVMKVSKGCGPINIEEQETARKHHRQRLDSMLHMSNAIEMLASMKGKGRSLRKSSRNHRR